MSEEPSAAEKADAVPRILLFFDYACSFCYVDGARFDRLKDDFDVEIVLIPYELRPGMPEEGISAKAEGLEHTERVEEHLHRLAAEGGLAYQENDLIPSTHRALLMGEVARDAGGHRRVHDAIFAAYFGEGEDIGEESVLLRIAEENGLAAEEVVDAWSSGRHEDRLHAFRHMGMELGIDATPAALICNELVIGSRPYGTIRDAVERCLVTEDTVEAEIAAQGGGGERG